MQPQAPSLGASGSKTSGAAADVITGSTIAASLLPQGIYEIICTTVQSGTVDTNYTNITLETKPSGSAVTLHIMPSLSVPMSVVLRRVELNGSQGLQASVGAGSPGAGSVYVAAITATRVA